MTARGVWLVKSEPYKYSFEQLLRDRRTVWEGVRNFEARNNLRAMKRGDMLLYYHSNEGKAIVGIAEVAREAYPDPSVDAEERGDWSAIDVVAKLALKKPVSLATIKDHPALSEMMLLKRSRLSVVPVREAELAVILKLAATRLPR